MSERAKVRVAIPYHLRTLAQLSGEVELEISGDVTIRSVLDELETRYPMLRGTIRDHVTLHRRPFIRYFACEKDLSNASIDEALPVAIRSGQDTFLVVGAIAGG